MSKLNMIPGRDFNFIFAGSERLFLRGFRELNVFQLLLEKFSEPVNGGKKFLVAFSGDGKYCNVAFLGKRKYANMIDDGIMGRSDILARRVMEMHANPDRSNLNGGGYESDEYYIDGDGDDEDTGYEPLDPYPDYGPYTGDASGDETYPGDPEELIYIRDAVPDVDYKSAIDYLEAVMNYHQDGIVVIDSDVITNATERSDVGWLIHFFDEVKKRSWSDIYTRATVLILFERDGCLEEFQQRMGGTGRPDFLYANVPELSSMGSGLSLKIMPPELQDLRNLTFKRMLNYSRQDSLHLLDGYVALLNQAISESEHTGCRTLTQIDNVLRYVLGSDDHSLDHLKRALSLDKIKRKKTWEDMKGPSANRTKIAFEERKRSLFVRSDGTGEDTDDEEETHEPNADEGAEEKPVVNPEENDPTFYYRTDVRNHLRLKGIPHFTLTGEPGTGKTTMASIMAAEFYSMGVIKSDCPVIVNLGERLSNSDLSWIHYLFEIEGRDRLIFIDEVESAVRAARGDMGEDSAHTGNSTLASALQMFVTKLLSVTTDSNSDTIVCIAGYDRGVQEFLHLDKGLLSRFPTNYPLDGYDGDVLYEIFVRYLQREYNQQVNGKVKGLIIDMFDELRSGLCYEDMDGWANARTAETIAEKAHVIKPTGVIGRRTLSKVEVNIGSTAYKLSDYMGQTSMDPLEELRTYEGTEELVFQLSRFQRRFEAGIPLPSRKNIALKCEMDGQGLDKILRLVSKFFKNIGGVKRPIFRRFNYSATLSQWVNRPTMLTESQFSMGRNGVLVFESPSEHFKVSELTNGGFTEQTQVIRREARNISNDDESYTVMVVIETPEGWEKIVREYGDFADLFVECSYSVVDYSTGVELLIKRLKEMNLKMDEEFEESMRKEFKDKKHRDLDIAIDEMLDSDVWKNGPKVLTESCVQFFREVNE